MTRVMRLPVGAIHELPLLRTSHKSW